MTDSSQRPAETASEPPKAPAVGSAWEDARGRGLIVDAVDIRDRLGRQVIGRVVDSEGERDYATTLQVWAAIWRDRVYTRPEDTEYR